MCKTKINYSAEVKNKVKCLKIDHLKKNILNENNL